MPSSIVCVPAPRLVSVCIPFVRLRVADSRCRHIAQGAERGRVVVVQNRKKKRQDELELQARQMIQAEMARRIREKEEEEQAKRDAEEAVRAEEERKRKELAEKEAELECQRKGASL